VANEPEVCGGPPAGERRALGVDAPFRLGFLGALGAAAALLLVRAVLAAAPVILLVGIALFFAIGLDPAVNWLQRRGLRRGWAVFAIVAAVISVVVVFLAAAAPPLVAQAADLRTDCPSTWSVWSATTSSSGSSTSASTW